LVARVNILGIPQGGSLALSIYAVVMMVIVSDHDDDDKEVWILLLT
jgi:hypothetical protein